MKRKDLRGKDKIRRVKVTPNFIEYSEGSCLMEQGKTKVICTASIEEGVPSFLKDTGTGWITAEYDMLPRSCLTRRRRERVKRQISGRTQEIQRLIGRSLRSVVNLKELGEKTIWIDTDVIQADGGTRCASITGSFIALGQALKKAKKDRIIDNMPLKEYMAAISVGIVEGDNLLDLSFEEDSKASVDMNIAMTSENKIVEIQSTVEEGEALDISQLNDLIKLAEIGINKLIDIQKDILKIEK
jgi:ribonuclease PH